MNTVAVILTPGFADWEYALLAGAGRGFFDLDVRFFSPVTGEVESMGGLTAHVSNSIEDMMAWVPDIAAVMGGTVWESEQAPDISKILRELHENGKTVAGICGGTLALARAGLLDTVPHTSNSASYLTEHATNYRGTRQYCDSASAIAANGVITAPGTAPVRFAAAIFEAIGMEEADIRQFQAMLAVEHTRP